MGNGFGKLGKKRKGKQAVVSGDVSSGKFTIEDIPTSEGSSPFNDKRVLKVSYDLAEFILDYNVSEVEYVFAVTTTETAQRTRDLVLKDSQRNDMSFNLKVGNVCRDDLEFLLDEVSHGDLEDDKAEDLREQYEELCGYLPMNNLIHLDSDKKLVMLYIVDDLESVTDDDLEIALELAQAYSVGYHQKAANNGYMFSFITAQGLDLETDRLKINDEVKQRVYPRIVFDIYRNITAEALDSAEKFTEMFKEVYADIDIYRPIVVRVANLDFPVYLDGYIIKDHDNRDPARLRAEETQKDPAYWLSRIDSRVEGLTQELRYVRNAIFMGTKVNMPPKKQQKVHKKPVRKKDK